LSDLDLKERKGEREGETERGRDLRERGRTWK
jgi:hypothetical protein